MRTFDIIIIGSGGGTKITQALNRLGKKTALIERQHAGGTCLNRGCIPSKMLIHPSGLAEKLRHGLGPAGQVSAPEIDFEALVASINAYTDNMSGSLSEHLDKEEKIEYIRGEARFVSDRVVSVNGEKLTAETIINRHRSAPGYTGYPGPGRHPLHDQHRSPAQPPIAATPHRNGRWLHRRGVGRSVCRIRQ